LVLLGVYTAVMLDPQSPTCEAAQLTSAQAVLSSYMKITYLPARNYQVLS